jgi:hypothetical protein
MKIAFKKNNSTFKKSFLPESFLLDEAIIHDIKKKYPGKEDLVDYFSSAGPNRVPGNDKYLAWIMKHHEEPDEAGEMVVTIRRFDRYGATLKKINPDINSYKNFESLSSALDNLERPTKELEKEGTLVVYQSPDMVISPDSPTTDENGNEIKPKPKPHFEVIRPLNKEASCKVAGDRTQWCIAATKSFNYYRRYSREGAIFYFIIDNSKPRKDPTSMFAYAMLGKDKDKSAASMLRGTLEIYNAIDTKIDDRRYVKKYIGAQEEEKFFNLMLAEREKGIPSQSRSSPVQAMAEIMELIRLEEEKIKAKVSYGFVQSQVRQVIESTYKYSPQEFYRPGPIDKQNVRDLNILFEMGLQSESEFIRKAFEQIVETATDSETSPIISPKILDSIHQKANSELEENEQIGGVGRVMASISDYSFSISKITDKVIDYVTKYKYELNDNNRNPTYRSTVLRIYGSILENSINPNFVTKVYNSISDGEFDYHYTKKTLNDLYSKMLRNAYATPQALMSNVIDIYSKDEELLKELMTSIAGDNFYEINFDFANATKFMELLYKNSKATKETLSPKFYRPVFRSPYLKTDQVKTLATNFLILMKRDGVTDEAEYSSVYRVMENRLTDEQYANFVKSSKEVLTNDEQGNKVVLEVVNQASSAISVFFNQALEASAEMDKLAGEGTNTRINAYDRRPEPTDPKKYEEYTKLKYKLQGHKNTARRIYMKFLFPVLHQGTILSKETIEPILELNVEFDQKDPKGKTEFSLMFWDALDTAFGKDEIIDRLFSNAKAVTKFKDANKSEIYSYILAKRFGTEETSNKYFDVLDRRIKNAIEAKKLIANRIRTIIYGILKIYESSYNSLDVASNLQKIGFVDKTFEEFDKYLTIVDKLKKEGQLEDEDVDDEIYELMTTIFSKMVESSLEEYTLPKIRNLFIKHDLQNKGNHFKDFSSRYALFRDFQNQTNQTNKKEDEYDDYETDDDLEEDMLNENKKPFYFNGKMFIYRG